MLIIGQIFVLLSLLPFSIGDGSWDVYLWATPQCKGNGVVMTGTWSKCIQTGGNSWGLRYPSACKMQSFSGTNCQGSSTEPEEAKGCHDVPFGSVSVLC